MYLNGIKYGTEARVRLIMLRIRCVVYLRFLTFRKTFFYTFIIYFKKIIYIYIMNEGRKTKKLYVCTIDALKMN